VASAQTPPQALERLRSEPAQCAVLLDIDGTLAPIVRHAADALVPEATRSLLIEVSRRYGLVACVTGRGSSDARRIVGIGTIAYVGNHGGELLAPGGTTVEVDAELREWDGQVRAFAATVSGAELDRLRVRTEDKSGIVAFHWRGAPDEPAAQRRLEEIAQLAIEEGLAVHWGRKVLEIRPPVAISKGLAIGRLLASGRFRGAMYVGDDVTDEDAFRTLRELREQDILQEALCVAVRSDEAPPGLLALADMTVEGPDGVRALLEALL